MSVWTEYLMTWMFKQAMGAFSQFPSPLGNLLFERGERQRSVTQRLLCGDRMANSRSINRPFEKADFLEKLLALLVVWRECWDSQMWVWGWRPQFVLWSERSDLISKQLSSQQAWAGRSHPEVPRPFHQVCRKLGHPAQACKFPAGNRATWSGLKVWLVVQHVSHSWLVTGSAKSKFRRKTVKIYFQDTTLKFIFVLFSAEFWFYQEQINFAAKIYITCAEEKTRDCLLFL